MAHWHDQTAIVWRDQPCSYRDLVRRTTNWVATLRDHGVGKTPVGTDVQALVSYLEAHPSALR